MILCGMQTHFSFITAENDALEYVRDGDLVRLMHTQ